MGQPLLDFLKLKFQEKPRRQKEHKLEDLFLNFSFFLLSLWGLARLAKRVTSKFVHNPILFRTYL